jgi:hypothetical protein
MNKNDLENVPRTSNEIRKGGTGVLPTGLGNFALNPHHTMFVAHTTSALSENQHPLGVTKIFCNWLVTGKIRLKTLYSLLFHHLQ